MMKNLKKIFKLSFYGLFLFVIKAESSVLQEGVGLAYGVSETAIINHGVNKSYLSKGREQKFITGAEIHSLSGKVSLGFNKVLNVYLEPETKMIINRFQFNEEKAYIEIFVPSGSAEFKILDEEKIELLVRTPEGIVKAR